jgi:hypothetical protein
VGLEFEPPRSGRRIDAVVLARDIVFLLEAKVGATKFERAGKWQIEQYALDLRDFHDASRNRTIVPILVATGATNSEENSLDKTGTVLAVQAVCPSDLATRIHALFLHLTQDSASPINPTDWENSAYRPTPSIVEAAQQIYDNHDVRDISTSDAQNLTRTVDAVVDLIIKCRREGRRGIAFITGAPGSGKTLAGLQVVHDSRLRFEQGTSTVFLSGNRPLVEVIREALAESDSRLHSVSKAAARRHVRTLIQHAYLFRGEYASRPDQHPAEHIVLFDEAQRAWSAKQVAKKTQKALNHSEPRILIEVMSRLRGWSVIVAMVGGGQEINSGEAGLMEWGDALAAVGKDWIVWAAPEALPGGTEGPGGKLYTTHPTSGPVLIPEPRLHLDMNVRSPRAERLNGWVDSLLRTDAGAARACLPVEREYPIALTRHFARAKEWLRERGSAGHQRFGLLASAGGVRLRAWGLDTKELLDGAGWANWFLRGPEDVRSSFSLEVPATSFDCQGLELDWAAVCWANDFSFAPEQRDWRIRAFSGNQWRTVKSPEKRIYITNGYRVLLTRARRGQIIWVPRPSADDAKLEPEYFDDTAKFLMDAGAQSID